MIKLKHYRIGLPTVNARVGRLVLPYPCPNLRHTHPPHCLGVFMVIPFPSPGFGDNLLAISQIVLMSRR